MMRSLKKSPRTQAKVVAVTPKYMVLKECYKYTGMEEKLFRSESRKFGLTVYARPPKKIWHKVAELDLMMESFKLISSTNPLLKSMG